MSTQDEKQQQQKLNHLENEAFKTEQMLDSLHRQLARLSHAVTAPPSIIPEPTEEDMTNDAFAKRSAEIEEVLKLVQEKVAVLQSQYEARETSRLEKENEQLRHKIAEAKATLRQLQQAKGEAVIPLPNQTEPALSAKTPATATAPKTAAADAAKPAPAKTAAGEAAKQKKKDKKVKKEKAKQAGGGKKAKGGAAEAKPVDVSRIDFRVGRILEAKMHPDADSLYVEQIDVGEEEPRTIISGLAKHVPLPDMQGRMVVICANLKPRKMRGIPSKGMVMCAKADDVIEPLHPPEGAVPGDVVDFDKFPRNPDRELNPKKKIFETVQPDLFTDDAGVANYKGDPFVVKGKGPCVAKVAKAGTVS